MSEVNLVFEEEDCEIQRQSVRESAAVPLTGDGVTIGAAEYSVKSRMFIPHADDITDIFITLEPIPAESHSDPPPASPESADSNTVKSSGRSGCA